MEEEIANLKNTLETVKELKQNFTITSDYKHNTKKTKRYME